jgi:opacity protein-like surface antigen
MRKLLLCTSALAFAAGATSASAADLGAGEIVEAPVYVAEGFSWNGLYFGGSVGWAWHDQDSGNLACDGGEAGGDFELDGEILDGLELLFPGLGLDDGVADLSCLVDDEEGDSDDVFHVFDLDEDDGSSDGWMASLFVGVNRQYGNFVVGAELEGVWLESDGSSQGFMFAHVDDDSNPIEFDEVLSGGFGSIETDGPDWIAHGTVKAGWLFGGMQQTLFYVKGGFAAADTQESTIDIEGISADGDGPFPDNGGEFVGATGQGSEESGYGFGGTLGVGVEHKFTQNFSLGLEYQGTFINYNGSHDVTFLTLDEDNNEVRSASVSKDFEDLIIHAAKVKATWHFN